MYHNADEIESVVKNLAAAHPAIAEVIALPELSRELQRTISCLRIGSNPAGAVDGVLFLCGQHAREWVPPEIAVNLMTDLISSYVEGHKLTYRGKSYSAEQVKQIVDNLNIFVLPCSNPDGRIFTQAADDEFHRMWRRNRNTSVHPNPSCQGVDLNRNYDFAFDLAKYFDTVNSKVTLFTSNDPCNANQVYHGPEFFSEPESRNVRWLLDTFLRIRWFIDIHGFKSEIYHPWGDDQNQSTNPAMNWLNPAFDQMRGRENDTYREFIAAGDLSSHILLAARLQQGVQPVRDRNYKVLQIFDLHPVSGSATDYAWSRHLVDPCKPRVEGFAIEVAGSDDPNFSGFQPSLADKDAIVEEVTSGLINFCLAIVSAEVVAEFAGTYGGGNIATLQQHTDWDTNWNLIVPGNFGGSNRTGLLFYKRSNGEGLFVSTDGNGNIGTLQQHTDWDTDWDLIVPGNFGGNGFTDLLFYKRSTGEGLFVTTDGSGNIPILQQHTDWDKDWDMIIPGNFGSGPHTDLLFYKRSTGEGLFVATDGSGNIPTLQQHTDWDKDWDLIVPGNFGGGPHTDLLFYKRSTGEGLFVATDGLGNIATIQQHTDWDKDWDLIIPGNFADSGHTGLLFYKRSTGEGLFVITDGNGRLITLQQYTNWDKDWKLIVPGSFSGCRFTDLLFYRE